MPESPPHSTALVKRALLDAGFEVFRTKGEEIVLAERPRENLIMDSGVRVGIGETLEVRVVLRAQRADFPNDDEPRLFERVRRLAEPALSAGFTEAGMAVAPVADPSDDRRTLDTFYEITFVKRAPALDDALATLRFALALEKRA